MALEQPFELTIGRNPNGSYHGIIDGFERRGNYATPEKAMAAIKGFIASGEYEFQLGASIHYFHDRLKRTSTAMEEDYMRSKLDENLYRLKRLLMAGVGSDMAEFVPSPGVARLL